MTEPRIYILYENADWLKPLVRALQAAQLPYTEWFLHRDCIDLNAAPPPGIFVNRISPSSHTRGHSESIFFNREVLAWLEGHGRRVVNGSPAYTLEVSKVRQYMALMKSGLRTPRTLAVCGGRPELRDAARKMTLPFITKHNCGGKGLGIRMFQTVEAFDAAIEELLSDPPIDHVYLLQEFVESADKKITRVEIVDGQFLYAIHSDTSRGFELCPAESCTIGSAFCPVGEEESTQNQQNRQSLFSLRQKFNDPIIGQYIQFMKENQIDIAGIEFIEDRHGNKITYDINCTTNYSPGVEEANGLNGMAAIAAFLGKTLKIV